VKRVCIDNMDGMMMMMMMMMMMDHDYSKGN
jgi:hypothetical protein